MEEKDEIMNEEVKETTVSNEVKVSNNKSNTTILLVLVAFFLGCIVMSIIVHTTGGIKTKVQKEEVEVIKTTTLEETSDLKAAISKVYDSVVYIEVSGSRTSSSGSGFVYKIEGGYAYILTNYHVVGGGSKYTLTFSDGQQREATYVNGDEYYDIAILKMNSNGIKSVSTLADSSDIELGDTVFTVGAPLGKEYIGTITKGIISGVNRIVSVRLNSGATLMEAIQTDASINSGNSGGPLCNIKGEVIGITSSKLVGSGIEGIGFAIPINFVKELLSDMEAGTVFERPYLGAEFVDISNTFALQFYYGITIPNDIEFGTVLSTIEENMPAAIAGLQVGDVIVEIDGEEVEDTARLRYILYKHKVGDKIEVKYYRGNKLSTTTIRLTQTK